MASGCHLGFGSSSTSKCKKITSELVSAYQKTPKMTYYTPFPDNYLKMLFFFSKWRQAAILDLVLLVHRNVELTSELDSAYQKTH